MCAPHHNGSGRVGREREGRGEPVGGVNHTCTSHTDKWVINLSKKPLTKEQLSFPQKGPNFAITPQIPPIEAYITATEQASSKLPTQEADELRSDVNRILKQLQQQHNQTM